VEVTSGLWITSGDIWGLNYFVRVFVIQAIVELHFVECNLIGILCGKIYCIID